MTVHKGRGGTASNSWWEQDFDFGGETTTEDVNLTKIEEINHNWIQTSLSEMGWCPWIHNYSGDTILPFSPPSKSPLHLLCSRKCYQLNCSIKQQLHLQLPILLHIYCYSPCYTFIVFILATYFTSTFIVFSLLQSRNLLLKLPLT
jgi:hypothetical protein